MSHSKILFRLLFPVILLIFISIRGYSQNSIIHNLDNNTLVNFSEALDYLHEYAESDDTISFSIATINYGYLIIAESLGESREISAERKEALCYTFKATGLYEKAKDLYKKEVFLKTDAGNFWFPIQDVLLGYWQDELKKGDSVLIYVRFYGTLSADQENKWLFAINGFNSGYYDGLWEEAQKNFGDAKDTVGLRCVKKLIAINPRDGRNYAMLGFYYTTKGKENSNNSIAYNTADSLFTIAERLSPEYSYQYFQRAILKFYIQDYIQSWMYIEKAKSFKEANIENPFLEDLESKLPYTEYLKTKQ